MPNYLKEKGLIKHGNSGRNDVIDNSQTNMMTTIIPDNVPVLPTPTPRERPVPPPKPKHQPIQVANLADYITRKKAAGRGHNLEAEFMELKEGQNGEWKVGGKNVNRPKNKFTNIAAYDHSRVVLDITDGDENSDYINASYIKGYKNTTYIATQGTKSVTEKDFWRMIWQEKVRTILMATNLIEQGREKCTQYWPELHKTCSSGVFIVKNLHEERFADSVIRTFHISEIDKPRDVREVKQFHFSVWPDMGVPKYPSGVLSFLRRVKASNPANAGPMVIHCSAGIGRTGTFITIDSMLEMAKAENQVDIFNFVDKCREARMNFVQTSDQYAFIYTAVLEATLCGSTEIPCGDLRIKLEQLKKRKGKKTGLQLEFENLAKLCPFPHKDEFKSASDPDNAHKNRYPDVVPLDRCRPFLMTPAKKGDYANYINASFLTAYTHEDAFIATQMPYPHTVVDFWRMVYDWKSLTIVMLNDMTEEMKAGQYWPDGGSVQHGPLRVEVMSLVQHGDILERKISLQHVDKVGKENPRFITQFQVINWPDNHKIPGSFNVIINIMNMVKTWQKTTGDTPVTVQCSNGIGRSGIFCTLVAVCERINVEQTVDVFQAVKTLRLNRPGMVETLAQYTYCYDATLNYLDQFATYQNFMT
uniref:protein-tyrosine-phosphatase n=1 Tax=Saccoglossus kowalevskii TaxID=10224 RepID=A0ABM0M810_SACKO|nr:PREDICTED: receptor-type tyrosine-protein phosphatase mu-like [Saccoglossus kowalevskii]